jgi:hypothetical protein
MLGKVKTRITLIISYVIRVMMFKLVSRPFVTSAVIS